MVFGFSNAHQIQRSADAQVAGHASHWTHADIIAAEVNKRV